MDQKQWGTVAVAGGMALVLLGHKGKGLTLFGQGLYSLEKEYRQAHPELEPGLKARWQEAVTFYEDTHQDETNRSLHRWGIPVILAGTLGLLIPKAYSKAWWLGAGAFTFGWILNFIGHGKYEQNPPAFTEDPLAFVAGPVWDWKQLLSKNQTPKPLLEVSVEHD